MTTVVLTTAGLVGLAEPAWAHARVQSTSPSAGSTVTRTLTKVSVTFDEAVTLVPHALRLTTDVGIPVSLESPALSADHTVLTARVQDHLAAGSYSVAWRVQADDGHLESSTYSFRIAGNGSAPQPKTSATPLAPPPPAPGEPIWPVLVAAGIALAGGVTAGVAVRRGLRIAAWTPEPDEHGPLPRDHKTSRLPM
jgi:methionine-rich copper-binding protein CopC